MDGADKKQFKEMFDGLSDYYQSKERLSKMALQIYFGALDKYDFEQITQAVSAHISNADGGKFFPKAGDIIRHLEGGEITPDMMLAAAKLCNSPLGVLANIKIGSWDLGRGDSYYLKQRAQECLLLLPEWKDRASRGEYTDHEISIMIKHNVNPCSPFALGIAAPALGCGLDLRVKAIQGTDRHRMLVEPTYNPDQSEDVDSDQLKIIHEKVNKALGGD